jgi:hypothetical protein
MTFRLHFILNSRGKLDQRASSNPLRQRKRGEENCRRGSRSHNSQAAPGEKSAVVDAGRPVLAIGEKEDGRNWGRGLGTRRTKLERRGGLRRQERHGIAAGCSGSTTVLNKSHFPSLWLVLRVSNRRGDVLKGDLQHVLTLRTLVRTRPSTLERESN